MVGCNGKAIFGYSKDFDQSGKYSEPELTSFGKEKFWSEVMTEGCMLSCKLCCVEIKV